MNELHLLAYLVSNPDRYRVCRPYLEELKLDSPFVRTCWDTLREKYELYQAFPSLDEAKWAMAQKFPGQAGELAPVFDYIYTTPVGGVSGEYLTELLIETEKVKLFDRLGTTRSISDLEELQGRLRILQDCLTMEAPKWFSPFEEAKIRSPFQTLQTYWGDPIPFGLPGMDDWMQGGGRRGELITLIGLSGGGKSILLLWWALYQAMMGYTVVYFSFDNVVGELLSRVWCAASGIRMDQTEATPEAVYADKLLGVLRQFPGIENRLFFEKHPRGTKTVKDIERSIDQIEQFLGRPIDSFYVDYGDCVKAEHQRKDTRFQLDDTFSSMGALAEEYNCLGMTATQANRAAKQLEILDLDSAAESWQKIWHSAIVMALCQSKLQKLQGKAGIVVPKARRVKSDYIVPILMDPNNMRVIQDPSIPIRYRAEQMIVEAEHNRQLKQKGFKPPPKTQESDILMAGLGMAQEREALMLQQGIAGAGIPGIPGPQMFTGAGAGYCPSPVTISSVAVPWGGGAYGQLS